METAYFDNAATTFPKPEAVYSFMDHFYRTCGVNVGRGQYALAAKAAGLVAETRTLLAEVLGCPHKDVVFTHTATEALNTVLRGLPLPPKANVYLSPFEHNAVTRVMAHLQEQGELNVHQLTVDPVTLEYDLGSIEGQFRKVPPNLVVMSHASNVCGVVAPVAEICALAKRHGAVTVVDMAQTAGLVALDVGSELVDYAIFAGHKTLYGPLGVGGFVKKQGEELPPLIFGGTGVDSANQSMPAQSPARYEAASANIAAIAGLHAALTWLRSVGQDSVALQERENHQRLLSVLEEFPNIRRIRPAGKSVGVVSCLFDGYSSDNIGYVLSQQNVAVRTGLHCAPSAHRFLNTFPAGTVRFSVSYFNTDNDFDQLRRALEYIEENG